MKVKYVRRALSALVIGLAALLIMATGAAALTPNLIQNGDFNGNLNGWIVNPALQTGTTPWTPLLADGSGATLHPASYYFNGMVLYQNLNVTGIASKQVTFQARLWGLYSPPYQMYGGLLSYLRGYCERLPQGEGLQPFEFQHFA